MIAQFMVLMLFAIEHSRFLQYIQCSLELDKRVAQLFYLTVYMCYWDSCSKRVAQPMALMWFTVGHIRFLQYIYCLFEIEKQVAQLFTLPWMLLR